MKRRDFVRAGLAGGLLAATGGAYLFARDRKTMLRNSNFKFVITVDDYPMLIDPTTRETVLIEDKIGSHSLEADPNRPGVFMGIPKSAHRISFFDFSRGRKIGDFKAPDGLRFYGHGTWSNDGAHFYSSLFAEKKNEGYLCVFRKDDFKEVARYQVANSFSHDIRWMPDQKTVAIACSGARFQFDENHKLLSSLRIEPGKLCFFDTEKAQVVHEVPFPKSDEMLGHMRVAKNGRVHVISSNFSPTAKVDEGSRGIYETSLTSAVFDPWRIPAEVAASARGEFLSIELNEAQNYLLITLPTNKQILQYDYAAKTLAQVLDTSAGGLAVDTESGFFHFLSYVPQTLNGHGRAFAIPERKNYVAHFLAAPGRLI